MTNQQTTRLLVYGINYAPELTGIGKYTGEMCNWLAKKCDVTVVTANPYYPEWRIHSTHKNSFSTEITDGVKVLRTPLYIPNNLTGKSRILHEFSFAIASFFRFLTLLFKKKYDVVICIAPPFHTGFYGLLLKFLRGSKLIYHIQDLQVDAAKDLGLISNKFLLKLLFEAEATVLNVSDIVTSISPGMINKIKRKTKNDNISYIPNWVETDFIKPIYGDSLRNQFELDDSDFVLLYSGNLGEKQGLNILVDAAEKLQVSHPSIKFLICGEGAYKITLKREVELRSLTNVILSELQPYEKLPLLLNSADVHLVLQKKAAADLVLPSKLSSITSAGGVVIVTAEENTSLHSITKENEIGVVIQPEDEKALIEAILWCKSTDLSSFKENSRKFALNHLKKDVVLKKFLYEIDALIE